MIDDVLVLIKNRLNTHLKAVQGLDGSAEDQVVFLDGQKLDPLTFQLGAVSVLLINVEEENILRAPDLYTRKTANGSHQKVHPPVKLNLFVLFVTHFRKYEDSLRYLSFIIRYFQNNRLFNHENSPELNTQIDQLLLELITLPFSEQSEVWSALRVTYHPSVLYKVNMVVFQEEEAETLPQIDEDEVILKTSQR
jgi:hypothetical protein